MTDEEKRLRDAFSAITVPKDLNEKTLHYIEAQRNAGTSDEVQQQSGSSKISKAKPVVKVRRGGKFRIIAALVACFCLVFAGMGGYAYATPSAFVTVEAPLGVALKVNCFDVVVSVEPFGSGDLQDAGISEAVVGKSYAEALDILAQANENLRAGKNAYDNTAFDVSIAGDNQQQVQTLQQTSEHCMSAHGMHGHCQSATTEQHHAATDAGMGVARYLAAQELITLDPSLTIDDCRDMSMAELRTRIAALGGEVAEVNSGVGCDSDTDGTGCSSTGGAMSGRGHGGGHGRGTGSGSHGMHEADITDE